MILWKYELLIIWNNNGNSHSNCGRDNCCVLVVFKMGKKLRKELMKEARELAKRLIRKPAQAKMIRSIHTQQNMMSQMT